MNHTYGDPLINLFLRFCHHHICHRCAELSRCVADAVSPCKAFEIVRSGHTQMCIDVYVSRTILTETKIKYYLKKNQHVPYMQTYDDDDDDDDG